MQFGDREEMLQMGQKRLEVVKATHRDAELVDADEVSVFYLLTDGQDMYGMIKKPVDVSVFA